MIFNINDHKNILVRILKDIYTNNKIGPYLGFKGGTAAYLFYDLDRFSVDLDFDLLNNEKEEIVFTEIEHILKKYGQIKDKANKRFNILYALSYSDKIKNVKIEINKRNFNSEYEVMNYLGISMLVMKKEDMFANKLVAMTERKKMANRAFFDVYFFLKNNWGINKKIVEKRTNLKYIEYIKKCIKFVNNYKQRSILSGMGELLKNEQKRWIKKNLKRETLFLLKLQLENNRK